MYDITSFGGVKVSGHCLRDGLSVLIKLRFSYLMYTFNLLTQSFIMTMIESQIFDVLG